MGWGNRQLWGIVIAAAAANLLMLLGAPSAAAYCSEAHADFSDERFLSCRHIGGPTYSWAVPARVFGVEFWVVGANTPQTTAGGIKAKLPVTPGDRLELTMGGPGEASVVSHGGEALLVAGGGNGAVPNYVDSDAETISVTEPGEPRDGEAGEGAIWAFWSADPDPPVDPFFSVIYDFFADETDGFSPAGAVQAWTAPDNLEDVVFELRGGAGESGFPEGHVIATFRVEAGESFEIDVGGIGEATTLRRAGTHELIARAAGGDDRTVNFLAPWASGATHYEGGGSEPFPWNGFAAVHQWMSSPPPPPAGDPPPEPEPKLPKDEAVRVSRPPTMAMLPTPNPPASAEGEPPRKAVPRHLPCRLRGRRVTQRRCRLLAGRLARQRAVAGRVASSTP